MRKLPVILSLFLLTAVGASGQTSGTKPTPKAPAPTPATVPVVEATAPVSATLPFTFVDFFTTAPTVTAGLDGGASLQSLASKTVSYLKKDGTVGTWDNFQLGSLPDFWSAPWVKLAFKGLELTWKTYYDLNPVSTDRTLQHLPAYWGGEPYLNNFWAGDMVSTLGLGLNVGALNVQNQLYFDHNGGAASYTDENALLVKAGNIEARLATQSTWNAAQSFLIFNGSFGSTKVTDAYLKVSDIAKLADLTVGGTGAHFLRSNSLFVETNSLKSLGFDRYVKYFSTLNQSLGNFQVRTASAPALFVESTTVLPVLAQLKLGDWTVTSAWKAPMATTDWRTWLAGANGFSGQSNNLTLAASTELKDLGLLDFGWDVGLNFTEENVAVAGVNYTNFSAHPENNRWFADLKTKLGTGWVIQGGLDYQLQSFITKDTPSSGNGTAANPFVTPWGLASVVGLGAEAKGDLGGLVAGLKTEVGLYGNIAFGKAYANAVAAGSNFDAYLNATYPTATYFRISSLSEGAWMNNPTEGAASLYAGSSPLVSYLKLLLETSPELSFWVANTFNTNSLRLDTASAATYFATAPKKPVGYVSGDQLALGLATVQGNATFTVEGTYTLYVGLPSSSDLGYASEATWWNESPAKNAWGLVTTLKLHI